MPHELIHAIRPFALGHIRLLTLRPVKLPLRRVESVELAFQSIFKRMHVSTRMQYLPRVSALAGFASLENDE